MTGHVDESDRALIVLELTNPDTGSALYIEAWIDTGFTGGLVLSASQIEQLSLSPQTRVHGILAGGGIAEFDAYSCDALWFGIRKTVEVLDGSSPIALVGTQILYDAHVAIDYPARTVELSRSAPA